MTPDDILPTGQHGRALPDDLKLVEARWSALRPRDDRLDRERLIFLAGRASVEAERESSKTWLGLPFVQNGWAAAFAAMSAIAAALLVALVTRSVPVEPLFTRVATKATPAMNQFVDGRALAKSRVLSTGDAHRRNIDELLTAVQVASSKNDTVAIPTIDERERTLLTPADWRRTIDDADDRNPSTNNSSRVLSNQGVIS